MYSLIKNQNTHNNNHNNKFTKISLTPTSSPTKKSVIQDALQNKEINYFNFNDDENLNDAMKQNLKEKRFFMTQNFSKVKFQAKQFESKFTGKRAKSEANILKDLLKEDQQEKKSLKKQDSYMFLDMMLQNNFIQGNFKDYIVGSAEDQPYLLKQKQTEFAIRNYSNELPVLPKPISLVDQLQKDKQKSFRSQNLQININGYGLSDMHAPFLVKTLKHKPVKSVEIGNNNFKDKGIEMILSELINYETQSLDLSFNTFTFRIMDSFQNVLSQEYSLKDLNLEGNKLGDAAIEKISKYALHLEILNVANNSITNQGAIYLNRMLKGQTRLRELKLHWNRINGIGGKLIAEALYHNDYLKVLDISYNSMGIGDPECSVYWAKMLSKDSKCGLIHLDLSYNRFDEVSSKIISNELRNNNTIYGLHYKGNSGEIDCQGFLVNINSCEQNSLKQEQEIQSTFRRMKTSNEIKGKFGVMENCWICEGWQEKEFLWNPIFSGPVELPPVFIHFNFDGYKPHQMKYINFNGRKYFSLFQMVPPNTKILYFFTAAGNQLHAKDQQWTIQEATITIQFADKSKECFLNKLNILRSSVSNQLYDSEYTMSIDCIPRKQRQIKQNISITTRIAFLRLENMYYIHDSILAKVRESDKQTYENGSYFNKQQDTESIIHYLATLVYKYDQSNTTKAILYHIYHHAIHDRTQVARDYLLMSKITDNVNNIDSILQIFYNRVLVQLGLAYFRQGIFTEAFTFLNDLCSQSGKIKELIGQSHLRYSSQSDKRKVLPQHYHINVEMIEIVNFICSMLIEAPIMVQETHSKNVQARNYRRLLDSYSKSHYISPPEQNRDLIFYATKELQKGSWKACYDYLTKMTVWRFMTGLQQTLENLMLRIKEQSFKSYLFQFKNTFDNLSLNNLVEKFQLDAQSIKSTTFKMVSAQEINARIHTIENQLYIIFEHSDRTSLQGLSNKLIETVNQSQLHNQRILDKKIGTIESQQQQEDQNENPQKQQQKADGKITKKKLNLGANKPRPNKKKY